MSKKVNTAEKETPSREYSAARTDLGVEATFVEVEGERITISDVVPGHGEPQIIERLHEESRPDPLHPDDPKSLKILVADEIGPPDLLKFGDHAREVVKTLATTVKEVSEHRRGVKVAIIPVRDPSPEISEAITEAGFTPINRNTVGDRRTSNRPESPDRRGQDREPVHQVDFAAWVDAA